MKNKLKLSITGIIFSLFLIQGCMNVVEQSGTLDDRPMLRFDSSLNETQDATIMINGNNIGSLKKFANINNKFIRVQPGKTMIVISNGDSVFHKEEVFMLEGTSRTIRVSE